MISDRHMSKLKHGIPLKLSIVQMFALLLALILAMISAENYATEFDNTVVVFLLFTISTVLNLVYVIGGPRLVTERSAPNEE